MVLANQTTMKTFCAGLSALALAAALSVDASAGVLPPELDFSLRVNEGNPIPFFPTPVQTGPDQWNWQGSYSGAGWALQSDITGGSEGDGPGAQMVNAFMAVTNNSANTNLYTITVNLPIAPILVPTLMDGSVGGAVTDSNGNGFASAAALNGSAIYWGLINGANQPGTALLPSPYAATVNTSGGTSSIGPASFGQPGPIPGPAGVNMIGIQLQILLSPGDTAVLTGFFRVEPIPAPAGLALLGLAGLAGRSRRRN